MDARPFRGDMRGVGDSLLNEDREKILVQNRHFRANLCFDTNEEQRKETDPHFSDVDDTTVTTTRGLVRFSKV